jgi:hypothetical protein
VTSLVPDWTVEADHALGAVVVVLDGFAEGEAYRSFAEEVLAVAADSSLAYVFVDAREAAALAREDRLWTVTRWGPRAVEAGIEAVAALPPRSAVADLCFQRLGGDLDEDTTLSVHAFEDRGGARGWLRDRSDPATGKFQFGV